MLNAAIIGWSAGIIIVQLPWEAWCEAFRDRNVPPVSPLPLAAWDRALRGRP